MDVENQINELQAVMDKNRGTRCFERYQAVALYLSGYTTKKIAQFIHRKPVTVSIYIKAYQESGLDGLKLGYSPGKPPKLTQEQQAILIETVSSKVPAVVGFTATYNWTLSLIAQFVKNEWGIDYTLHGMSGVLHRLGLSHTRPTYTLEKADPEKQREFVKKTLPTFKKD